MSFGRQAKVTGVRYPHVRNPRCPGQSLPFRPRRTAAAAAAAVAAIAAWLAFPATVQAADIGEPVVEDVAGSAEFARVFANPGDLEANLAYAQSAEARGELRIALATYERILVNFPGNPEALEGLSRIRRLLEPDFTNWTLSIGGGYNSNPLQRSDAAGTPDSGFGIVDLALRDDRDIDGLRWRTRAYGGGILLGDAASAVNTAYFGGDIGPVWQLTPRYDIRASLEGAYRALQGGTLYGEIGGAVEVEGFHQGATQAVRLRVVHRSYGDAFPSDDGVVVDLDGRFSFSGVLTDRDAFIVRPHFRYSGVDGNVFAPVFVPLDFAPGQYFDFGGRIDYNIAVSEYVILGAKFSGFYRGFTDSSVPLGPDTNDWYIAPGASAVLTNIVSDSVDLRLDYEHQLRRSNDASRDFDADVVAGRLVYRF